MYLSYQVIALDQMRNDSKKWFYEWFWSIKIGREREMGKNSPTNKVRNPFLFIVISFHLLLHNL